MPNAQLPAAPVPPGPFILSKKETAERQLRCAVWLWFHECDSVSIHALSSAAAKVLWKLNHHHNTGHATVSERLLDLIKPDKRKEWLVIYNKMENFIKHADNDPHETMAFNPELTPLTMFDATTSLEKLSGNLSDDLLAFKTHFIFNNQDFFLPPLSDQISFFKSDKDVSDIFSNQSKISFFELFLSAQQKNKSTLAAKIRKNI